MSRRSPQRYFDLSLTLALGAIALLFISLPGGCWDRDGAETEESDEPVVREDNELTPPPMMEIVERDPSEVNIPPPEDRDDQPAPPPPAVFEQPDDGTYIVQPGDTLHGIAVRYSVGIDELMEVNNIADPNTLQVGQILRIPGRD
jgi:LysM repeat protein